MRVLPQPRSEHDRLLVQTIWDLFCDTGAWPTVGRVAARLDRQHDLVFEDVLDQVPRDLLFGVHPGDRPADNETVGLTIAGAAAAEGATVDLDLVVTAIRLAADKQRRWEPPAGEPNTEPLFTSAGLAHDAGVPPGSGLLLARVGALLHTFAWGFGSSNTGTHPSAWSFTITRGIRAFRDVTDLGDLWDRSHPATPGAGAPATASLPQSTHGGETARAIRYQVFISSTYADLQQERAAVTNEILRMGNCIPAGMELFSASNTPPWDTIEAALKDTDYFVLILAERLGSLVPDQDISYTEREYRYARDHKIPVLAFLTSAEHTSREQDHEHDESAREALRRFRGEVKQNRLIEEWTTVDDLTHEVTTALWKAIRDNPRPGWVRGDPAHAPQPLEDAWRGGTRPRVPPTAPEPAFTIEHRGGVSYALRNTGTAAATHVWFQVPHGHRVTGYEGPVTQGTVDPQASIPFRMAPGGSFDRPVPVYEVTVRCDQLGQATVPVPAS